MGGFSKGINPFFDPFFTLKRRDAMNLTANYRCEEQVTHMNYFPQAELFSLYFKDGSEMEFTDCDMSEILCFVRNAIKCDLSQYLEAGNTLQPHQKRSLLEAAEYLKVVCSDDEPNNVVELSSWERRLLHKLFTQTN